MRATTVLTAFFPASLTPTLSPGGERGTILPVPVITVGRQFGAGGATVGHMLATEPVRVKTIMARFNIGSEDEARRRLKQTDENWTSYIRQVYGHDRNHPAHYDMVLDTGRLGYEATVDAILEALKRRKPIT